MNGDGKVTVREVDSLMALQFKAAHETLTGRDVKRVLAEHFAVTMGDWSGAGSASPRT